MAEALNKPTNAEIERKRAEQRDTIFKAIELSPEDTLADDRQDCSDHTMYESGKKQEAKGIPQPQTSEVCLKVLEVTAKRGLGMHLYMNLALNAQGRLEYSTKLEQDAKAKQWALEYDLDFVKGHSQYYNERIRCMNGKKAISVREGREKGLPEPDVGAYCLEVLKHSANVETDPVAKADRPDQELLAPYRNIAKSKQLYETDQNANKLVDTFVDVANDEKLKSEKRTVTFTINGLEAKFPVTPASAFDSAFTQAVLNNYANKPAQVPTGNYNNKELAEKTEACFQNKMLL